MREAGSQEKIGKGRAANDENTQVSISLPSP